MTLLDERVVPKRFCLLTFKAAQGPRSGLSMEEHSPCGRSQSGWRDRVKKHIYINIIYTHILYISRYINRPNAGTSNYINAETCRDNVQDRLKVRNYLYVLHVNVYEHEMPWLYAWLLMIQQYSLTEVNVAKGRVCCNMPNPWPQ